MFPKILLPVFALWIKVNLGARVFSGGLKKVLSGGLNFFSANLLYFHAKII